jgi:hypothetical protein
MSFEQKMHNILQSHTNVGNNAIQQPNIQQPLAPTTLIQVPAPLQQSSDWYESPTLSPVETHFFTQQQQTSEVTQQSPILPTGPPEQPLTAIKTKKKTYGPASATIPVPRYHPTVTPPPGLQYTPQREHEKVFPNSLLWSCTHHDKTPQWARVGHSAMSLHNDIVNNYIMSESDKMRFRQMPTFRQIPTDGVNHITDMSIFYECIHNKETFNFKTTTQLYDNQSLPVTTTLGKPLHTTISFPTNIITRFLSLFLSLAEMHMRPANLDVQQQGHILTQKSTTILDYSITYMVMISQGTNGLERIVHFTFQKNNLKCTTLSFPWVRMGLIHQTMLEVIEDMKQQGIF